MYGVTAYIIILLLVLHLIVQSSCNREVDATTLRKILNKRGRNSFSFASSYFYGDGVTRCSACSECSTLSKVENLFSGVKDEDYCIKCEGDDRCDTEKIIVQVDFDFDFAWSLQFHSIKSSSHFNDQ